MRCSWAAARPETSVSFPAARQGVFGRAHLEVALVCLRRAVLRGKQVGRLLVEQDALLFVALPLQHLGNLLQASRGRGGMRGMRAGFKHTPAGFRALPTSFPYISSRSVGANRHGRSLAGKAGSPASGRPAKQRGRQAQPQYGAGPCSKPAIAEAPHPQLPRCHA